jgi:hypothetical protein
MTTKKKPPAAQLSRKLIPRTGLGKADPLPKVGAPDRPKDYVPTAAKGVRTQPADELITAAPAAAQELASSKTYTDDFGKNAPDPQALAENLAFAAAWSAEFDRTEQWYAYVKEQTRIAWSQANPKLDSLGPVFAYALEQEPNVRNQYPSTSKLYDVRREPAVKGAAVKASLRANGVTKPPKGTAKAKKGAASPVADAPPSTDVSAQPAAPAAPAATTPAKS